MFSETSGDVELTVFLINDVCDQFQNVNVGVCRALFFYFINCQNVTVLSREFFGRIWYGHICTVIIWPM